MCITFGPNGQENPSRIGQRVQICRLIKRVGVIIHQNVQLKKKTPAFKQREMPARIRVRNMRTHVNTIAKSTLLCFHVLIIVMLCWLEFQKLFQNPLHTYACSTLL